MYVFDGLNGKATYGYIAETSSFSGIRVAVQDVDGDDRKENHHRHGRRQPREDPPLQELGVTPLEAFYAFDASFTGGVAAG